MSAAINDQNSVTRDSGSAADLDLSLTVAVGDAVGVYIKWEAANSQTVSAAIVSGSSASFSAATFVASASVTLKGGFLYLLDCLDSGAVTVRISFTGSGTPEYVRAMAFSYTPDSGDTCAVVSGSDVGQEGSSTNPISPTFSPTITDGVVMGGFAEFTSANPTTYRVDSSSTGVVVEQSAGYAAMWCKLLTTGFTSGTVDGTGYSDTRWLCSALAFEWTGSSTIEATYTEGGSSGDTFSVQATLGASTSEGAVGSDLFNRFITIEGTYSEAGSASDSDSTLADLLADASESGLAGEIYSALGELQELLLEAADAGEVWASDLVLQAVLEAGGAAGDTWTAAVGAATLEASLSEGSSAADTFLALMSLLAALTEGAVASETLIATAILGDSYAEGALAGDTWTATIPTISADAQRLPTAIYNPFLPDAAYRPNLSTARYRPSLPAMEV